MFFCLSGIRTKVRVDLVGTGVQVRIGWDRSGQVGADQNRTDQNRIGLDRLGYVITSQDRTLKMPYLK